jgi:hypothetical protein
MTLIFSKAKGPLEKSLITHELLHLLDKSIFKPITEKTIAGSGDMTLPSMTILLKF